MEEVWKDVPGYEGLYKVSNIGKVMSLNFDGTSQPRVMNPYNVHGYKRLRLFKDKNKVSIGVHRLVAMAFIPNPENKPFINHKDGDPNNNTVENLEWATHSENITHAYRVLGAKASGGRAKKSVRLVETGQVFTSIREASRATGHNRTSIISCCKGRYKSVRNMHWEYAL